jgi:hypothetical protein
MIKKIQDLKLEDLLESIDHHPNILLQNIFCLLKRGSQR